MALKYLKICIAKNIWKNEKKKNFNKKSFCKNINEKNMEIQNFWAKILSSSHIFSKRMQLKLINLLK